MDILHHGYGGVRRDLILSYAANIVVYEIAERRLSWNIRTNR